MCFRSVLYTLFSTIASALRGCVTFSVCCFSGCCDNVIPSEWKRLQCFKRKNKKTRGCAGGVMWGSWNRIQEVWRVGPSGWMLIKWQNTAWEKQHSYSVWLASHWTPLWQSKQWVITCWPKMSFSNTSGSFKKKKKTSLQAKMHHSCSINKFLCKAAPC